MQREKKDNDALFGKEGPACWTGISVRERSLPQGSHKNKKGRKAAC